MTYTRHEIPLLKIIFKLKFFLAKHESDIILKVFKVKVLSVFGFDAFLTMLNALWWIYKKAHHRIFDFMFLVSSVLSMVSKTLFVCSWTTWIIWTGRLEGFFVNLKPVEISKNHSNIIWSSLKVVLILKIWRMWLKN